MMADEAESKNLPPVLIVDDEEVIRQVMRDILTDSGYEVDVVENGEKALAQLKNKTYGLVFADIRMPKMDGMEFLRRAKHLTPDLDIIMMTGYASVDIAVEAIKLGAQDFITKPFNLDHIRIVAERAVERKALKKQAEEGEYYKRISLTDGLTELFNRRHLRHILGTEISRSERSGRKFCLLMVDVDDFKVYNDTLGHPAGDEALKFLAWLLKHHARISDVVCRYGGEEFVVVFPETDVPASRIAAERLRRIIEETEFDRQEVLPGGNFTVSIGMACFPDDATSADELVSNADKAMYHAKRSGKNRLAAWTDISETARSRPSEQRA
ncbi:MAG: diguanylate cyclase [Candidatus Abyssobacteria bacterium SURF_17]|uniref:diguanylate cyclase n=1 Tax=Candidatus Abyssobacteria bacterium SURF_17 TaxID=2093361 RepID=A0A419F5S8_9BACT|nr:MAG: diguanylate cyclase [Candidatus Abyssubacteria bacterium SURF_17]